MAKEQEVASAERLAAEGRIASDESAVAEPEIEAYEDPVDEPKKEPEENVAAEGESGEAGCPIWMGYDNALRCGRTLHAAPDGIDEQPVCLMHSKDPCKQSGQFFDAFWREFERTLEEAGEGLARFEHFVFPRLFFVRTKFQAVCQFSEATFTQYANFSGATFTQFADFSGASFTQGARFFGTTFTQDADFNGANFTKEADFETATFSQGAKFTCTTFEQRASFVDATFMYEAVFYDATFIHDAIFIRTTFTRGADFSEATFTHNAEFIEAIFSKNARFEVTRFNGTAYWQFCQFLDQVNFRSTKFEPKIIGRPSALFGLAKFSKPNEVIFEDVDLSRVSFHVCDVSQVWFTPSVRWGNRKNNRGLVVFEEVIDTNQEFAKELQTDGQRDYRAVAQIYQQLKKNYDSRLDYWTANEFHFGEMEMKRLAVPASGRLLWLRRWWHRNLSFVAWYKYASDYGNSYRKPLLWLLAILLAATLMFPITGLELKQAGSGNAASSARVTYSGVWDKNDSWTNNFWAEAKLIGKSGITAIDTATFQRTPEYTPVYPRGRVVAIVETLLTSSLFALFLLAIRRQFRR